MQLEKIAISNFKSLRNQTFVPTQFGCLVGENNAGKSSVLQAVVTALNRPSQLAPSLFYDQAVPVEFEVTFSGVDERHIGRLAEEHRARIAAIVIAGNLTLKIRYRVGEKVEIATQRLVPRDPRLNQEAVDAALAGKRGAAAIREAIAQALPEFLAELPEATTTLTAAKAYISERISHLPPADMTTTEGATAVRHQFFNRIAVA